MSDPRDRPAGPRTSVVLELLRALGEQGLLLPRVAGFLARRGRLRAELAAGLADPAEVEDASVPPALAGRRLKAFVSCAEPSGELHAVNAVRAVDRELARIGAAADWTGIGSERLERAGVRLLADPMSRAAMGTDALGTLPYWTRLLARVARHLEAERPALCLMVDSPALHVPLARIARRRGASVVHLATPQYWAWAPWRVRAYAEAVDLALTILPFEPAWFRRRGVTTAHVGHPLLDELPEHTTLEEERRGLVLLPGSRSAVIARNLPWMVEVARRVRHAHPELAVSVLQERAELAPALAGHLREAGAQDWITVDTDDLHGRLGRARAALSVSGTVLLDLLHHRVPAVVVYRVANAWQRWLGERMLTVPWFASVNLLAGREILPEYLFHGEGPLAEVVRDVEELLFDEARRATTRAGLDEAARHLGPAGATERAARHALALVARTVPRNGGTPPDSAVVR